MAQGQEDRRQVEKYKQVVLSNESMSLCIVFKRALNRFRGDRLVNIMLQCPCSVMMESQLEKRTRNQKALVLCQALPQKDARMA